MILTHLNLDPARELLDGLYSPVKRSPEHERSYTTPTAKWCYDAYRTFKKKRRRSRDPPGREKQAALSSSP